MTCQTTSPDWVVRSSPGYNRPLVPRVERLSRGVRAAAANVQTRVDLPFEDLYRPNREGLGFTLSDAEVARRSAWALIGEWLVAASVGADCVADGLATTHAWFWQGSGRDLGTVPEFEVSISGIDAVELRSLMPYLLDPLAAATRRDVLKAHSTVRERGTRKASGVYYTPGDVAYLMVQRLLDASDKSNKRLWFDPAHGSGVFLRAILSATHKWHWHSFCDDIYGVDLDPIAAETSSFVLTAEDLFRNPEGLAPWQRWHRFRRNLATGDALLIDAVRNSSQAMLSFGGEADLADGNPLGRSEPWRLESVFPEIGQAGFSRIVANPPYAPLQRHSSRVHIGNLHPVTGTTASQDISPIFVELCTNLLRHDGALSVVLPLSAVASTRAPFPALRTHLLKQGGRLELLSFDRAPDALFGDDIKTRNSIVHLDKSASPDVAASPLLRWTSRIRATALTSIPTTSVAGVDGVPKAIPKIGTEWEHDLFLACGDKAKYLRHWHTQRRLLPLEEVADSIGNGRVLLALAPTAYNFLGVMREPRRAITDGHDSRSNFSILGFECELHASVAYALLSSRLAFWLWHVMGDGFHVTSTLCRRVPVPVGDNQRQKRLADLGERLWTAALETPVVSSNRGRTTVSYPTWTHTKLVDEIDAEVGAFIGLDYGTRLAAWHEELIVVDLDSERRDLVRRKIK